MTRAVLLVIVAEGLLTLMDALIKLASQRHNALQISFMRYAGGSLWTALLFLALRPGWPSREAVRVNGFRAVLIACSATLFFFALGVLPLAETIALAFLAPVFMAMFGALLLGERLDWRIGAALAIGLAGMALIVGGSIGSATMTREAWLGAGAVVVSAVLYALVMVLLRSRAQQDPLPTILLFQTVVPMFLMAGPAAAVWRPPTLADVLMFVGVGGLGLIGHAMMIKAFAAAEAARLAPVTYVTLAWGVVYGYLMFGDVPGLTTLAGAGLIVVGALITRRK